MRVSDTIKRKRKVDYFFFPERDLAAYIQSQPDRPTLSKSGGVFSAVRMQRVCCKFPYLAVVASRFSTDHEVMIVCLHGTFSQLVARERHAHWVNSIGNSSRIAPDSRTCRTILASYGTRSLRPLSYSLFIFGDGHEHERHPITQSQDWVTRWETRGDGWWTRLPIVRPI